MHAAHCTKNEVCSSAAIDPGSLSCGHYKVITPPLQRALTNKYKALI